MTIRTLLVDDEFLVRRGLRSLLREEPDFTIVGEACDGGEALQRLHALDPDVVFLDVRMPELDGFEVLDALELERWPAVVFVTAHDEYALRAFEVHAVDYLLKPFDAERFAETLRRVRHRLEAPPGPEGMAALLASRRQDRTHLERVLVKRGKRILFVDVETVDWFEAADNYVRLHVAGETYLIRHTIKGLESRLDPRRFARVHRSTIVHLGKVASLEPTASGNYLVRLTTGAGVTLSRGYRERFQQRVGWRF